MAPNHLSTAEDWRQRLDREGGADAYLDKDRDLNPRLVAVPDPVPKETYWRDLVPTEPAQIELPIPEPVSDEQGIDLADIPSQTSVIPSLTTETDGYRRQWEIPVVKEGDSPELQRFLKRIKIKKLLAKTAIGIVGVTAVAALAAVAGYMWVEKKGREFAEDALESANLKTGITLVTNDKDQNGVPVGMVYGREADKSGLYPDTLYGNDRSIPVDPETLGSGGSLYYWYQALMALEDQGHEGGLSDKLGFDPMGLARVPLSGFTQGGSNISNQTCGALSTHIPAYENFAIFGRRGPNARAAHDYACGIGLATTHEPREIAALYATYGYMGPKAQGAELFVRIYWDLASINDQSMTIGHQLVMASAIKYPWDSEVNFPSDKKDLTDEDKAKIQSDDNLWESIADRSKLSVRRFANENPEVFQRLLADLEIPDFPEGRSSIYNELLEDQELHDFLLSKEIIDLSQTDPIAANIEICRKYLVVKKLYEQIDNARPMSAYDANQVHPGLSLQPTTGYAYPRALALDQARELFGPEWRTKVRSIVLTIDPNVQYSAVRSAQEQLNRIPGDKDKAVVLVVNEDGRIIAAYSGNQHGYDHVDRINSMRQPASMGKLLLVHAVDQRNKYRHDDTRLNNFKTHLRYSNAKIQHDARMLGVRPEYLRELIDCYGDPLPGRGTNPIEDATLGVFSTSPALISRLMVDPYYSGPMNDPWIVDEFIMIDGTRIPGNIGVLPTSLAEQFGVPLPTRTDYDKHEARVEELKACHALIQPPGDYPIAQHLVQEPLQGTLPVLQGLASGGKTGTKSQIGGSTNVAWTIANMHRLDDPGNHTFVIVVGIGGDTPKDLIGRRESGGKTAGPVARDVLQVVRERSRSGHLDTD